MTVPIKIEIMDADGNLKKRIGADVPEDITLDELVSAMKKEYRNLLSNSKIEAYVAFSSNVSGSSNLIYPGAVVVIQPRGSSKIRFYEDE